MTDVRTNETETPEETQVPGKTYIASLIPGPDHPLPDEFGFLVQRLEELLDMPIWLLIQCGEDRYIDEIGPLIAALFLGARHELSQNGPIAFVIDSPGGHVRPAYQIAMLIRRTCGGFTAVIPRYAKSAATLLALGADTILMSNQAELGPLDAIYLDPDREAFVHALDEFQSLERLTAFALKSLDEAMMLLVRRSGKSVDTLLPIALNFLAQLTRPLFEGIDVVHYTMISRILKVAEDYAIRLLEPKFSKEEAELIASHLVGQYSEHGFVINREEAIKFGIPQVPNLGLQIDKHSDELELILDAMLSHIQKHSPTYVGQAKEVAPHG